MVEPVIVPALFGECFAKCHAAVLLEERSAIPINMRTRAWSTHKRVGGPEFAAAQDDCYVIWITMSDAHRARRMRVCDDDDDH